MPENAYIQALDAVSLSPGFQSRLITNLQAAAQGAPEAPQPAPSRPRAAWLPRVAWPLAACALVALLLWRTSVPGYSSKETTTGGIQAASSALAADAARPEADVQGGAPAEGAPAPDTGLPADDLPVLTLFPSAVGGMGFEGYMAYDIDELVSGNPWSVDAALETLPVFQNAAPRDAAGVPLDGLPAEAMSALAHKSAAALGLVPVAEEAHPSQSEQQAYRDKVGEPMPNANPTSVELVCEGATVEVERNGSVMVWLDPTVALPAQYSFTHYDTSYAQAEDTLAYLAGQYAAFVDMQVPTASISGGDRNIYAQQSYQLGLYEGAGTLTDQILAYHFDVATFANEDAGELYVLRRHTADLSRKLGDYPLISVEEAQAQLAAGHYTTTVPEAFPGAEYVAKVELVYRTADEILIPGYRFYVEMPDMQRENGLKTYGAYYVPAIPAEYISNYPLWDGSFN